MIPYCVARICAKAAKYNAQGRKNGVNHKKTVAIREKVCYSKDAALHERFCRGDRLIMRYGGAFDETRFSEHPEMDCLPVRNPHDHSPASLLLRGNRGGYTVHTAEYDKYHRYGCGNTGDRTGDG